MQRSPLSKYERGAEGESLKAGFGGAGKETTVFVRYLVQVSGFVYIYF